MIAVRCFDSLEAVGAHRDEVDALNGVAARPDPFSTLAFFEAYLRHDEQHPAGRDMQLWFLAAYRAEVLVGYVALKRVTRRVLGMPIATLGFLVTHDTDRPHVVARAEDMARVCEAFYGHLLARKREWSYLEFQQQDDSSSLFPPPAAVDLRGYLVREWPTLENCTVPVSWTSLQGYFQALSKMFRSNLGRQLEALFAEGEVALLSSSDPATTPALLDLYLSIEPRSWKVQAEATIGRCRERVAYFRSLLGEQQPMRVSIHVLLLDGVPLAGIINGAFRDGLYALHIVYDDRANRLAPGSAMLLLGMRQAIDGGYAFFNLLSGFGYYKTRWLAKSTETRIAQIYRTGGLLYWRRVVGDWKRRWLAPAWQEARQHFNPVRRALVSNRDSAAQHAEAGGGLHLGALDQERTDAMVAAVRRGRGEFLSAVELAAVLPISLQRRQRSRAAAAS